MFVYVYLRINLRIKNEKNPFTERKNCIPMDPSCCELACDLQTSENPGLKLGEAKKMEPQNAGLFEKESSKTFHFQGRFFVAREVKRCCLPPPKQPRMTCVQLATRICVAFKLWKFSIKTEGSHVHFFVSGGDVEPSKIRISRFQEVVDSHGIFGG